MRSAIMGAGGIGGYWGAKLAASGNDVVFNARGAHRAEPARDADGGAHRIDRDPQRHRQRVGRDGWFGQSLADGAPCIVDARKLYEGRRW